MDDKVVMCLVFYLLSVLVVLPIGIMAGWIIWG